MLRWFGYATVFLVSAGVVLFSKVPLEFGLSQAGLPNAVLNWTSSEGTITKGRLNTVSVGPQTLGDILLQRKAMNPLNQSVTYDLQWGSPGGNGAGSVTASRKFVNVRELRLQQQVAALPGLALSVRELGGTVRITNGSISIRNEACEDATGDIYTDVLTRLGNQFGRSFDALTGTVSCADGHVLLALSSSSSEGDSIMIDGSITLSGIGNFTVLVKTGDPEIELALSENGFEQIETGVWQYTRQT